MISVSLLRWTASLRLNNQCDVKLLTLYMSYKGFKKLLLSCYGHIFDWYCWCSLHIPVQFTYHATISSCNLKMCFYKNNKNIHHNKKEKSIIHDLIDKETYLQLLTVTNITEIIWLFIFVRLDSERRFWAKTWTCNRQHTIRAHHPWIKSIKLIS